MNKKILLVEDEEKIARFTELELKHEGYEVTKAFNAEMDLPWRKRKNLTLFFWILCFLN